MAGLYQQKCIGLGRNRRSSPGATLTVLGGSVSVATNGAQGCACCLEAGIQSYAGLARITDRQALRSHLRPAFEIDCGGAAGGVPLIDDFGHQMVSSTALRNRWIVPLENRVDYLKLSTGKSLRVPFQTVLIFSTNLAPTDLIDLLFLRSKP